MTVVSPDAIADLARDAWRRGCAAADAGLIAEAERWLDRAHRLLPRDRTIALMLATVMMKTDPARAGAMFREIAESLDLREAWLGLAGCSRARNDGPAAAAAIARLLRRHAVKPDQGLDALAEWAARQNGYDGWCGLTGDGRLVVRSTIAPLDVSIVLDGTPARLGRQRTLPGGWREAARLDVTMGGGDALGSPIDIRAMLRCEGFVAVAGGEVRGWAWHPGDPDRDPVITLSGSGRTLTIKPTLNISIHNNNEVEQTDGNGEVASLPLARRRHFRLNAPELAGFDGPVTVRGDGGRELTGSPVDPGAEQRAAIDAALGRAGRGAVPADIIGPKPPVGCAPGVRPGAVVIPVHGSAALTLDCIDAVLETVPRGTSVIVVDDASLEPDLRAALDSLVKRKKIRLVRHAINRGFPASANAGMIAARGRDVALLNSDTIPPPGWFERLRDAVHAAADVGTASPLSNDATILSYPEPAGGNPVPDKAATARLAVMAAKANGEVVVEIPTSVGFCMYIRGDCLEAVGPFREDAFGQGYGEENDFCIRARHLGWRHVAVPGAFVAHVGGASFGAARDHLIARNMTILNRLHPGYDQLIAAWTAADPLREARRDLDLVRWRAARARRTRAAILVTHADGGGVEKIIRTRCEALRAAGMRPIVLRPIVEDAANGGVAVSDGPDEGYPNLCFALPAELPRLVRLLKAETTEQIEFHHTLGHHPSVLELPSRLGVPHDVHVHDYVWLCPRVALVGPERRYCGEPPVERCAACLDDAGRIIGEDITTEALRARSARLLGGARDVLAPSSDAARRIRRHFPAVAPQVRAPGDDRALTAPPPARPAGSRTRVCVAGAIGVEKGLDILIGCVRDAAERRLPLEFVVAGHTVDDARLLRAGPVFVTGPYRPGEAVDLIRRQAADLAFLPSVWPETWCFALTEVWQAGLDAACFDIGAMPERIRARGRGWVFPLGLPPAGLNNALMAAASKDVR